MTPPSASSAPTDVAPAACVLLATCEGADYVRAQLDSIQAQTLKVAHIIISDDGSTDATRDVIAAFARDFPGQLEVVEGPRTGFAMNFLSLIARASDAFDLIAFSDQDDVWHPEKLAQQWDRLQHAQGPAMIGCRCWISDSELTPLRLSPPMSVGPDFGHALMQNYAGGNTLVVNRAGLELAQRAMPRIKAAIAHDWMLYQIFTGAGAEVLFHDEPLVYYRQHATNLMGENSSLRAAVARFLAVLSGEYRDWLDTQTAALNAVQDVLNDDAKRALARFEAGRKAPARARLAMIKSLRLCRRGRIGQAALYIATALGRI